MVSLDRIDEYSTRFSKLVAFCGFCGLLMLAGAMTVDGIMRTFFNSPITGVRDLSSVMTSVTVASCFVLCVAERANITVRFVGDALGSRWKNILEAFGDVMTLGILSLIARQLWLFANDLADNNETSMVLGWPLAPFTRVVCVLLGLCVPVNAVILFRRVKSVFARGASVDDRVTSDKSS